MTSPERSLFASFVERFIPPSLRANQDTYDRAFLLCAINVTMFALAFPNALLFGFFYGATSLHALVLLAFLVNGFFTVILLRKTESLSLVGHLLVSVVVIVCSTIVLVDGGIKSYFTASLPIPFLLAILVLGRRAGIGYATFIILFLIGVTAAQKMGIAFHAEYSAEWDIVLSGTVTVSAIGVICVLSMIFHQRANMAQQYLVEEKVSIERKVEEARDALRREQEETNQKAAESLGLIQAQQRYSEESARQILDAMQRFSLGDLTVQVENRSQKDDIGKIFTGCNQSVSSVRELVREVIHNVEQTNTIALHISSASGEMAATSEQQAAQVTEIASSVEQMARSVSENAHQTVQIRSITEHNGTNAVEGAGVVGAAVKKIEEIASVVSNASVMVEKLGNSSAEIGEIVQVIEEIADQTNLLALNAAIEAARAGDQGRGFAVVADEVRKLAERTAQATKQIGQTIKQIQRDTEDAVTGMKRGDSEVRAGLALAKQAGDALERIVGGSREVESMVQGSANALHEQSSTAEQIAKSVEQVSSSVNETTASLSEIARATENLSNLTEGLRELVKRFDVGHQGGYKLSEVTRKRLA
jgi:methyl-accepting chemotaxis protein